jgi:hypothetical protein
MERPTAAQKAGVTARSDGGEGGGGGIDSRLVAYQGSGVLRHQAGGGGGGGGGREIWMESVGCGGGSVARILLFCFFLATFYEPRQLPMKHGLTSVGLPSDRWKLQ